MSSDEDYNDPLIDLNPVSVSPPPCFHQRAVERSDTGHIYCPKCKKTFRHSYKWPGNLVEVLPPPEAQGEEE